MSQSQEIKPDATGFYPPGTYRESDGTIYRPTAPCTPQRQFVERNGRKIDLDYELEGYAE